MSSVKKYALLIGLNYKNSPYPLNGCWNDVVSMKKLLEEYGYFPGGKSSESYLSDAEGSMVIVTDEKERVLAKDILTYIDALVRKAKSGDYVFFHFSGHGGQLPDERKGTFASSLEEVGGVGDLDENDGMDETIFGSDLIAIRDDVLRARLVDALPEGVKLRVVLDCCHSGTGLDLPFIYRGTGAEGIASSDSRKVCKNDVICFSGCRDDQTSADAFIDGSAQGALTSKFVKYAKGFSYVPVQTKSLTEVTTQPTPGGASQPTQGGAKSLAEVNMEKPLFKPYPHRLHTSPVHPAHPTTPTKLAPSASATPASPVSPAVVRPQKTKTWKDFLIEVREDLSKGRYTQIPQISFSTPETHTMVMDL